MFGVVPVWVRFGFGLNFGSCPGSGSVVLEAVSSRDAVGLSSDCGGMVRIRWVVPLVPILFLDPEGVAFSALSPLDDPVFDDFVDPWEFFFSNVRVRG